MAANLRSRPGQEPLLQQFPELPEGPAPVTDAVFFLPRHLRPGLADAFVEKDRVVTEAALTQSRPQYLSAPPGLRDERRDGDVRIDQNRRTMEAAAAFSLRHICQFCEQFVNVLLVRRACSGMTALPRCALVRVTAISP